MIKTKIIALTAFISATIITLVSCALPRERPPVLVNDMWCGKTEGSFRGEWWSYYESAMSFADCGLFKEAELDLLEAIGQWETDERDSRTYGMHFMDYFPHRELGVVYFHQGRYKEALEELEASLYHYKVKTSKTVKYVNLARKAVIQREGADKAPPVIEITYPAEPLYTSKSFAIIKGVASDDTFVRAISAGDNKVGVDVSEKRIEFVEEVPLTPGENRIPIVAKDLMGNESRPAIAVVYMDRTPPSFEMDQSPDRFTLAGDGCYLSGNVFDESGLSELVINGRSLLKEDDKVIRKRFRVKRVIPIHPGDARLEIKIVDLAGNITPIRKILHENKLSDPPPGADEAPPEIFLDSLTDAQATYLDAIQINGYTTDNHELKCLLLNGERLLAIPDKIIYFSQIVELDMGENIISLQSIDFTGNSKMKRIRVTRKDPVREIGAPLKVELNAFKDPFDPENRDPAGSRLRSFVAAEIESAMRNRGRFDAIGVTGAEKKSGADCFLFGVVTDLKNSTEIDVRLVDVETSEKLSIVNVYAEGEYANDFRSLSRALELELAREIPRVGGRVVKIAHDRFYVDLGVHSKIKAGMKLLAYKPLERSRLPGVGDADESVRILGEGRFVNIKKSASSARFIDGKAERAIEVEDFIITR